MYIRLILTINFDLDDCLTKLFGQLKNKSLHFHFRILSFLLLVALIVIAKMSQTVRRRMRGIVNNVRTSSARLRNWRRRSSQVTTPPWNHVRSPQTIDSPVFHLFDDTSRRQSTNDTFELTNNNNNININNNNNNNNCWWRYKP